MDMATRALSYFERDIDIGFHFIKLNISNNFRKVFKSLAYKLKIFVQWAGDLNCKASCHIQIILVRLH